jgi:hypothetical protein
MSARRAFEIFLIVFFTGAGCTDAQLVAAAGKLRVVVTFDTARGTPGSFNIISHNYSASRTGDAAGAPTAANSSGSTSGSDTQQSDRASQGATFTFPDKDGLMQGAWSISLNVTGDGTTVLSATCANQTLRAAKVLVVTFTQQPTGTNADCTSTIE